MVLRYFGGPDNRWASTAAAKCDLDRRVVITVSLHATPGLRCLAVIHLAPAMDVHDGLPSW
jgi:hypothetical protein